MSGTKFRALSSVRSMEAGGLAPTNPHTYLVNRITYTAGPFTTSIIITIYRINIKRTKPRLRHGPPPRESNRHQDKEPSYSAPSLLTPALEEHR